MKLSCSCNIPVLTRGIGTGMAGMVLAVPIFQRAQSNILAHYVHTIISVELSTEANTSASHGSVVMIPNKFHFPKTFLLSKRFFRLTLGSKNEKVRALILQTVTPYKK